MSPSDRSFLNRIPFVSAALIVWAMLVSTSLAQPSAAPAKVAANYGNLPLSFEANRGQADPAVKFLSRANGYSLLLTDSSAVLWLSNPASCQTGRDKAATTNKGKLDETPCSAAVTQSDLIRMTLAGTARLARTSTPTGEAELAGKANYFLGNDPSQWHTGVPTYAKVRYANVYKGVDLVYYGNHRQLEYDFIVAAGANPAHIQLRFPGQQHLKLAPNGDLMLQSASSSATLLKPILYQEKNGQRQPVSGAFKLLANNTVTFAIGSYDLSRSLVIDPVLVYSTYLGGSGSNGKGDEGNGIAVDSAGNAYVVGTTYSANFPVTAEAFQPANNAPSGASTVFVTKLNAAGNALLYSTYLGGSGGDFGYGIAIDKANNVYVTGATYSADFPVTCGAFQTLNPSKTTSAPTAFVTKLNPESNTLAYSTYLGGTGNQATPAQGDIAQAIAVNAAGNAYVTGYTWSSNFPVSDKAFQTAFAGSSTVSNGFVTELTLDGTALAYSTFLGGSGSNGAGDFSNAIALDASGDAFVTGTTNSANFPVTSGAFQTSNSGKKAFVVELNPTGTESIYATYLGGSGGDSAQAIAVDSQGFAYVAGITYSSDFPLTDNVLEGANSGIGQFFGNENPPGAFVTKLNRDGSAVAYSTYLEGQTTDVNGLAVDATGHAYITGSSPTIGYGLFGGFQPTPDALPVPASTGNSAFLVKLDTAASVLNYATLLGGSSNDGAKGLALDVAGNVYLAGGASSADFPVTDGAFQTANNAVGVGNAFVGKFALAAEANQSAYPVGPPSNIGTSISSGVSNWFAVCDYFEFTVYIDFTLTLNSFGPPPTGSINLTDSQGACTSEGCLTSVSGSWGIGGDYSITDGLNADADLVTYPYDWNLTYSGDSVYAGSSFSGSASYPACAPDGQTSHPKSAFNHLTPRIRIHTFFSPAGTQSKTASDSTSTNSNLAKLNALGPKFNLPPVTSRSDNPSSQSLTHPEAQSGAACIAPRLVLTVSLSNAWRYYGATNPKFVYTLSGLVGSDTVTVTPSSVAKLSSPVGSYPILATVTGADASKYTVTVKEATLSIHKAPLHVEAKNTWVTYGETPAQPSGYFFYGFLNGDTQNVVIGAPALSTAVTAKTPVGSYPIDVQLGTLSAANYALTTAGNGLGAVWVYKAVLVGAIDNQTMHQGNPVPPLTYSLTGFVNGDTASNSVTGAPVLTTKATSASPPGKYPITGTLGTLASHNYDFTAIPGVMTVLP